MAKRRRRSLKSIPLLLGNDPALWRFNSLQEALEDSTTILAQVLRSVKEPVEEAPIALPIDEGPEAGNIAAR